MNERGMQFRVGVVVLATLIITVFLILTFSDSEGILKRQRRYYVVFDRAPGLIVGTPVRKSGILVGRASEFEFTQDGQVLVTVRIDEDIEIRKSDRVSLTSTLLGDAQVEFRPEGRDPDEMAPPDHRFQGEVQPDPLRLLAEMQGNVKQTIDAVGSASEGIDRLARRVDNMLGTNQDQFRRIIDKSEATLDEFSKTAKSIDGAASAFSDLLGDPEMRTHLRDSLKDMPKLLRETRETVASIHEAAASARKNLRQLEGFTRPLGESGERIVGDVQTTVSDLSALVTQLRAFSETLNSSNGTLGQLVNNPDLYQNLNRAAQNIQQASRRLEPIINDVRIFTDKIARDPGRIGVSGAIQRRAPIK